MPEKTTEAAVYEYALPDKGVNLHDNIVTLEPNEAFETRNLVMKDGLRKRGGQSLVDTDEVVSSKRITGLHKAYFTDGTSQLLASAGTAVKYLNSGTWTNVQTGLTDDAEVFFTTWGALDKVYFANGNETGIYSWDGSSVSSLSGGSIPQNIVQLLPYQDRLLAIDDGDLTWSASFDDTPANWIVVGTTNVRPDTKLYGMVIHAENNTNAGYTAKVLLAGANGMYLFQGTDLSTPVTGYTIYPLPGSVGCNAPRTMTWTPRGTMWLGIDKQVYLLPFDSATPVPIGDKIRDEQGGLGGIESIPSGQIKRASAVYHDGYYKLSITRSGGSNNTDQWWLDVTAIGKDRDGAFPWFGPMSGQSIGPQISLNGPGDIGEHYGGEATAKGYVYQLSQKDVLTDVNPADASNVGFECKWSTFYNPLGGLPFRKAVHHGEIELKAINQTINVTYRDIAETLKTGSVISLGNPGIKWGAANWGVNLWNSNRPSRQLIELSPPIYPRRLSILISSSATNDLIILALRVKALEQSKDFD